MDLYNLDKKITNKSYEILNSHIEQQKEIDASRVSEIRTMCKNILEQNGIFEDRKNGIIYLSMEKELSNLANNIDYYNEYFFEEITKNKIDIGIENLSVKIDSLEQKFEFEYETQEINENKASSESRIRDMIFTYFESYKENTIDMLLSAGYSQNTIEKIEDDILEYVTSKSSDIITEKIYQDRIRGVESLSNSLNNLAFKLVGEAEARYICQVNGQEYDELKEKRDSIRQKAQILEDIRMQIASIDLKTDELSGNTQIITDEKILL